MTTYMLTTVDNPYNPSTQFDDWYLFDVKHDYNTLSLLARLTNHSNDLSEPVAHTEIQKAIDEIVTENVSGMHRKVLIETVDDYK